MRYTNKMDEIPYNNPQTIIVGRREIYTLLQQHLVDPSGQHVHVILGWRGSGKSALLQALPQLFDDSFVTVYLPLSEERLADESTWLASLMEATAMAITARGLQAAPTTPRPDADWLQNHYLPDVLKRIRSHRQLVWLWDNASALSDALQRGTIPYQHLSDVRRWLDNNAQLSIVLALDTRYEDALRDLQPLIHDALIHRLSHLSPEESAEYLMASGRVTPAIADTIYRLSGGNPSFLACFYQHIIASQTLLTAESLVNIAHAVYKQLDPEFRERWQSLNRDERYVLTAISNLIYEDPLRALQSADIEAWLAQTDFPMDSIAVRSAIRGLEYHEHLRHRDKKIVLSGELWQRWLLENARIHEHTYGLSAPPEEQRLSLTRLLLLTAIIVLLLLLAIFTTNRSDGAHVVIPTATLSN